MAGREVNPKRRAAALGAEDRDKASVLPNNIIHQRQPKAGTHALWLGRKKRLKDMFQILFADTGARVSD